MPKPRKQLICRSTTPYYHCMSRCVRRAFLCGRDKFTGKSYTHRKQWILERLHLLSSLFAIDVCAYAIMENHYHLVLKIGSSNQMSDYEVISRWLKLFKGSKLTDKFYTHTPLNTLEEQALKSLIAVLRTRLEDISWFMKCLNEPIAKRANKEDECTGHFWEARFKSQALHTNQAVLACMAYVDLNPVRAGIAKTPLQSNFTSYQQRLIPSNKRNLEQKLRQKHPEVFTQFRYQPPLDFKDSRTRYDTEPLPFRLCDYKQLVEWTARKSFRTWPSSNETTAAPFLVQRAGFNIQEWLALTQRFEDIYSVRSRQIA